MIIPSFYLALHDEEAYPEPDAFKPERWLDANGPAVKATKNWIGFGAGPHKCIGEQYLFYNMMIAFGNAAVLMDWEHVRTAESDEVQ